MPAQGPPTAIRYTWWSAEDMKHPEKIQTNFQNVQQNITALFGTAGGQGNVIQELELEILALAADVTTLQGQVTTLQLQTLNLMTVLGTAAGSVLAYGRNPSTNAGPFLFVYSGLGITPQKIASGGQSISVTFTPRTTKAYILVNVQVDVATDAYLTWLNGSTPVGALAKVPISQDFAFGQLLTGLTAATPITLDLGLLSTSTSGAEVEWGRTLITGSSQPTPADVVVLDGG